MDADRPPEVHAEVHQDLEGEPDPPENMSILEEIQWDRKYTNVGIIELTDALYPEPEQKEQKDSHIRRYHEMVAAMIKDREDRQREEWMKRFEPGETRVMLMQVPLVFVDGKNIPAENYLNPIEAWLDDHYPRPPGSPPEDLKRRRSHHRDGIFDNIDERRSEVRHKMLDTLHSKLVRDRTQEDYNQDLDRLRRIIEVNQRRDEWRRQHPGESLGVFRR
jgi:hypothetical protein